MYHSTTRQKLHRRHDPSATISRVRVDVTLEVQVATSIAVRILATIPIGVLPRTVMMRRSDGTGVVTTRG